MGDAIREQVKTYRDVDVSNNKPTGKARVWVNTASNDTESQDILLPQVDDNNVSEENTWSSKKVDSEIGEVREGLIKSNIFDYIIIPKEDTTAYSLFIQKDQRFAIKTKNGSNFGVTGTVRFLRQDGSEIDYYSFFENTNHRDLVNDLGDDIYYVKVQNGCYVPNDIMIIVKNEGSIYGKVENALSEIVEVGEKLNSLALKHFTIPSGSKDIYPLVIYKGSSFTVETVDGTNFETTTTVRFLRQDGSEIDYYSLFEDTNHRDLVNDLGDDIYYVKVSPLAINKDIRFIRTDMEKINSRLDSLEFDGIPTFYKSYLSTRILTLLNYDIMIGNHGDSFVFITDLHNENNYYSPVMANVICQKTSVNKIIYGGDYINEPSSKDLAINKHINMRNTCRTTVDTVFLKGNHDTNPYGTGQISNSEFYGIYDKQVERFVNTNKMTYFYSDNESQKIRYFYLDTGVNGLIDDEQNTWFKNNIVNLNTDWTVVVFMHHGIYTDIKDDRTNIKEYNSLSTIKSSLKITTANIACIVCGHTHIDLVDTSEKYPVICTTCDAHGVQSSSASSDNRTVGTICEQAFDVFYIDTSNRKIYVIRIGGGENDIISSTNYSANDRTFNF